MLSNWAQRDVSGLELACVHGWQNSNAMSMSGRKFEMVLSGGISFFFLWIRSDDNKVDRIFLKLEF